MGSRIRKASPGVHPSMSFVSPVVPSRLWPHTTLSFSDNKRSVDYMYKFVAGPVSNQNLIIKSAQSFPSKANSNLHCTIRISLTIYYRTLPFHFHDTIRLSTWQNTRGKRPDDLVGTCLPRCHSGICYDHQNESSLHLLTHMP